VGASFSLTMLAVAYILVGFAFAPSKHRGRGRTKPLAYDQGSALLPRSLL